MKDNIFKSRNHQDHDDSSFHNDAFEMIDTSSTKHAGKSGSVRGSEEEMLDTIAEINRLTDASPCGCEEDSSPGKKSNK